MHPTEEPQSWSSSHSLMSLLRGHEHTGRKQDPWDSASEFWGSQPRPLLSAQCTGHTSVELEMGSLQRHGAKITNHDGQILYHQVGTLENTPG